jgi:5-methyltetrahydropteroyltriglutamate--homocysteine methyltransferase
VTTIQAVISGIYPRSEALVQATRDHDRRRITRAQLAQQLATDRQQLFRLQQETTFDLLTDGLLNWQDLFRPLVEACQGMTIGPLVRQFNTNTFYRQPRFEGTPRLDAAKLESYFTHLSSATSWRATLPSPCALAEMSAGEGDRMIQATKLLTETAQWLLNQGISCIQLQDSWLAYHSRELTESQLGRCAKALNRLVRTVKGKVPLGLHLPFGDAAPLLRDLWRVPFDFIGVDFYQTDLEALGNFDWSHRGLLAGCVNGRNSLMENEEEVCAFVERLLEELQPRTLLLSNNVDLEFVPEPIARRKVELLGRVKRHFAEI